MRFIPAVALALVLGLGAASSAAEAASILGSWSGRGTVKLNTGQVEPVSCRVRYEKGDSAGRTFTLNATCAAAAGTFSIYGRISQRGATSYRGVLFSEQSTMAGNVDITLRGNSHTARVRNDRGTGQVTLRRR